MKILIVGYGSMGRRRIRLLKSVSNDNVFMCVDNNPKRLEQIKEDGHIGYARLDDAISEKPDVAFVCTSPGHHAEIILSLVDAGIHVFTELNLLSDKYEEIILKAQQNNVKVFMSNTMLYDKEIKAIMQQVGRRPQNHTYLYHIGQYLPDWHPWESYKDFFIGKKETNGCREILAIQLPWLIKLFGKVEKISTIRKKSTKLDIDFNDTYVITLEHENGNTGVFICDVLARKAITYLEILSEKTHIIWNGSPDSLLSFDEQINGLKLLESYKSVEHLEGYAETIHEDEYLDEIKAFFDYIFHNCEPLYSLEEDKYIINLIDEIEGIE